MRTTFGATVVVALVLLAAAIAIVVLMRRALTEQVESAAEIRAEELADSISSRPPDEDITLDTDDDEFVQVLDSEGAVIASSEGVRDEPPLLRPGDPGPRTVEIAFDDDPFLVVGRETAASGGAFTGRTVVVGRTLDTVVESTGILIGLLAAGLPLVLALVGAITWVVVGRALSPVEGIRTEVEAISSRALDRRVPEPGTGDEVDRLAETMNAMLARLEEGHKRQRRFVSDASHELRSPVASIRQLAEVALTHPDRTDTRDLAGSVLEEDLRVERLVEDLLLLARLDEQSSDDGTHRALDLDDVVFEAIRRTPAPDAKRIDSHGVSAGRVLGDAKQLARLVDNLLTNAVRHARTKVEITLKEEGNDVVLRVEDDGPGIAGSERQRVFERFVRLEEARDRDSGGVGLGLAIVADVARAHGGVARAGESPLGGARLEVRLPRVA